MWNRINGLMSNTVQATWGHQAYGVSPADFLQLLKMAANTTGVTQAQRCLTSVMQFCFGRQADLLLKCITEIVTLWFEHVETLLGQ